MRREPEMEQLTRQRREQKLAVPEHEVAGILRALNQGNQPESRITSVYFDCRDHRFARSAVLSPARSVRLRTKEYQPDLGGSDPPRCVVDLKSQAGDFVTKRRSWIIRAALTAVFGADQAAAARFGPAAVEAHATMRAAAGGEPLFPVVAITYRRTVHQSSDRLRVTVDRDLTFHRVAPGRLLAPEALRLEDLGEPVAREERVIVEVKSAGGAAPNWVAPLFAGRTSGFSKFGAAVKALNLHGEALR